MNFNFRHVRYFVAAARAGQISRAAVELNVSQSAVTAAILQLETLLGLTLFDRQPSGVVLTHTGSRFLMHAENILAAVEEAIHLGGDTAPQAEGEVRLAMTYTVAGYFAPPILARARRLLTGVRFVLTEATREDIERGLVDDDIDIALLLTSNLEANSDIEHVTLVRSRRRLWLSSDHPLTSLMDVALSDIRNVPYIGLTVDEAMRTQHRYWEDLGFAPNVVFETSSVEAVRTMVAAGMGVTVLSDMVYRPWSLDGRRLETRNIKEHIPEMDIGFAWKVGNPKQPLIEQVVEFFRRNSNI